MLKSYDVVDMKHCKINGTIKLSCMRKLMSAVDRAAKLVNCEKLLKTSMTEQDAIRLHRAVKHMFMTRPKEKKIRRHATLAWKSYYNMMLKRNWQLFGEQYDAAIHFTKKNKRKRKPDAAEEAQHEPDPEAALHEATSARPTKKRMATNAASQDRVRNSATTNCRLRTTNAASWTHGNKNSASKKRRLRATNDGSGNSFSNSFDAPTDDQQRQMQGERDKVKKARPHVPSVINARIQQFLARSNADGGTAKTESTTCVLALRNCV